ncbi:MAG TPA: PASTA domain-containing protein [Atribacteraceae bacterium]|nr:PASTA domain-containing protein [Atribacteraceae bacterium]
MVVKKASVVFFAFRFFLNVLLFGLGLILSAYLGLVIFQYYLTSNALVLPDFRNLDLVGAVNQASQLGIRIEVQRVENDPAMPSNIILSQNPMPGVEVKRGRKVRVILNGQVAGIPQAAADVHTVPDVVEMDLDEGRYRLENEGFQVGRVVEVTHETVPMGLIISQNPPAASSVPAESTIQLLVSTGSRADEVALPVPINVPDVVGLKLEEARSLLTQRGLMTGAVEEVPLPDRDPGIVVRQTPEAGASLLSGESVGLAVSQVIEGLQEMRLRFPLPDVAVDITVQVVVHDDFGERVVYERVHQGGEMMELIVETKGRGRVVIYLNGFYYWEREI